MHNVILDVWPRCKSERAFEAVERTDHPPTKLENAKVCCATEGFTSGCFF